MDSATNCPWKDDSKVFFFLYNFKTAYNTATKITQNIYYPPFPTSKHNLIDTVM